MPTEEVKVFHQLTYNFRIKRPLPVYDLPRPPGLFSQAAPHTSGTPIATKTDKEKCVIFPIFKAYDHMKTPPTYIINSAFWAAHSWRVNSDCIDNGWDIYFLLDRELWKYPEVQAQFEAANLTDFIVFFDMLPGRATRHKLGAKLYAITIPDFTQYNRCYLWDVDNFVSIRDPQDRLPTDRLIDIGEDESLVNTMFFNGPHERTRAVWQEKYEEDTEEYSRPIYDHYLEAYLGHAPEKAWGVSGQVFVWNPQQIRQDFKDMIIELTPNIADDEDQYGAYVEKTGASPTESLNDIWEIPIYFEVEQYFSDDPYYFDHIWLKREEDDYDSWFANCDDGEVGAVQAYNDPKIVDIWTENIGIHRRL